MSKEKIEEESSEEKEQEESELEEGIVEVEEEIEKEGKIIEDNQFNEFLQPSTKSSAPVLDMINAPQESLEQGVEGVSISNKEEDKEGVNYSPNDSKYSESVSNYTESIRQDDNSNLMRSEPVNVNTIRDNLNTGLRQTIPVNQNNELEKRNIKYESARSPERLESNNRNPFEQREEKYKGKPI
tara:strand:+ start:2219 stop:2770 length:552 start_codon:yes stop_codon:yes gene_type:complete